MSVLVAGSANLDFVVRVPHVPAAGETVLGRSLQSFPGGKGANQAIACARAGGVHCRMLVGLGDDAHARPLEASLRAAAVELHIVRSAVEPTGVALIGLSDTAENAIIVAPGANSLLRPDDLPPLVGVSHLLLQLETPLASVAAYAARARAAGVQVVLNAAPAQALPLDLLRDIDVLVVNEGELAAVTAAAAGAAAAGAAVTAAAAGPAGDDTPAAATLEARLALLPVPLVIVTLGAAGCLARAGREFVRQPGFAVEAVDTTAAGDTFCGVLVAGLSEGLPLGAALQRANAAAALACTRIGAQPSIPTRAEVDAFLRQHPAEGEHGRRP